MRYEIRDTKYEIWNNGKSKRLRRRKAQSAIIDAAIFFLLLTIGSAVIYLVSARYFNPEPLTVLQDNEYANDFLYSVLISTVQETSYDAKKVYDHTVQELIEIYLRDYPATAGSQLEQDIENKFQMGNKTGYSYLMEAKHPSKSVTLILWSDSRYTSSNNLPTPRGSAIAQGNVDGQQFNIMLYVWRAVR